MKKVSVNKFGYYDGPGGVFYDAKNDAMFTLEFEGTELMDEDTFEHMGKFYAYKSLTRESKKAVVAGMTEVFRLGDL